MTHSRSFGSLVGNIKVEHDSMGAATRELSGLLALVKFAWTRISTPPPILGYYPSLVYSATIRELGISTSLTDSPGRRWVSVTTQRPALCLLRSFPNINLLYRALIPLQFTVRSRRMRFPTITSLRAFDRSQGSSVIVMVIMIHA